MMVNLEQHAPRLGSAMVATRELSHTFARRERGSEPVRAVDGIDMDVAAGEIVSLLGPNGAGKTTTMRILTTLLAPTAGTATVAGYDVRRDAAQVRRRLGYVSQTGTSGGEARCGDEIVDRALLYGVPAVQARRRAGELFEQFQLEKLWARKPRTLSGGQKRRLDLVMGLAHQPSVLVLDEPTTGLDPQARANLWQHIAALRAERGVTVLLTTHYLDEADSLSDRVMVIDAGRIVAADRPDALKQRVNGDLTRVDVAEAEQSIRAAHRVARLTGVQSVHADGTRIEFRVARAATVLPALLHELSAEGITLTGVDVRRPTLDDVFLTLTGRSLREGVSATPVGGTPGGDQAEIASLGRAS